MINHLLDLDLEGKRKWWHWLIPWRYGLWTSMDVVVAGFFHYHVAPYVQSAGKYFDEVWDRYSGLLEKLDHLQKKQDQITSGIQELQEKLQKVPLLGDYLKKQEIFGDTIQKDKHIADKSGSTGELVPSLPAWLPKPRTDSAEHLFADVFMGTLGIIVLYRAGKRGIKHSINFFYRLILQSVIKRIIKKTKEELEKAYGAQVEKAKAAIGAIVEEKIKPLEGKVTQLEQKISSREKMLMKLLATIEAFKKTGRYDPTLLQRLKALGQSSSEILNELKSTHQEIAREGVSTLAVLESLAKDTLESAPTQESIAQPSKIIKGQKLKE